MLSYLVTLLHKIQHNDGIEVELVVQSFDSTYKVGVQRRTSIVSTSSNIAIDYSNYGMDDITTYDSSFDSIAIIVIRQILETDIE